MRYNILFFLILNSIGLVSQIPTFSKIYDNCMDLVGVSVFESENDFILVNDNISHGKCLGFSKIDSIGNLIWDHSYPEIKSNYTYNISEASNDSNRNIITFAGYAWDVGTSFQDIVIGQFSIAKKDTTWIKHIRNGKYNHINSVQTDSLGNSYLYGDQSDSQYDASRNILSLTNSQLQILKIDSSGNLISTNIIQDAFAFSMASTFDILPSGEILISYRAGPSEIEYFYYMTLLDQNFQKKWTVKKEPDEIGTRGFGFNLSKAVNDSIYLMGCTVSSIHNNIGAEHGRILAYDISGNLVWDQILPATFNTLYISSIYPTSDGNILVCGGEENLRDEIYPGFIAKIDTKGNLIWFKRYYDSSDGLFYDGVWIFDVLATSDGGIISTGLFWDDENTVPPGEAPAQIYVLKLDNKGCLEPNCDDFIYTSSKDLEYDKVNATIFPNPSNTYLNFAIKNIGKFGYKILDMTGKLIIEKQNISNQELSKISVQSWKPGMYFLQLFQNNQFISTKKIMITK